MSLKETIELMFKRFPRCPLCKSDEGYKFSGWIGDYVQCRHCGAKWLLHDWLSDKPMMELVGASRDPERGTVVGHELLRMVYPVSFWQKMKVKRLRGITKKVEKETVIPEIPPEVPEVKEAKEKPIASQQTKIIIGVIAFILIFSLIEVGIWWYTIRSAPGMSQATFTFVVESNTEWSGAFGTLEEGQRTEEGFGDASFTFHGSIASACVQKMTEYGYLTVEILKDGQVVASQSTSAPYGVVTVSASS